MGCRAYWNHCTDCSHEHYSNKIDEKCEKCGSVNIEPCVEYDEDFKAQDREEGR